MSFKKPFKAVPIKKGLVYRRQKARNRRAVWLTTIGAAVAIGSGVGYLSATTESGESHLAVILDKMRPMSREDIEARERSVFFAYCDQARAAGVAPISRGEPGYRPGLDADGDGEACEPYP